MNKIMTVVAVLIFTRWSVSQTLTTAETIGKKKQAIFIAANALAVKDFTILPYVYGQLVYGLADRVDLYVGPGITGAKGKAQASLAVGANTNLLKSKLISVSSYNIISTGLNNRKESSSALLFSSIVVSKNFKIKSRDFTGYSGYSFLVPLGTGGSDKLFTPPKTFRNIPFGLVVPMGKKTLFLEYDYGRSMQMFCIGLAISP